MFKFILSVIVFFVTKSKTVVYFVIFILASKDIDFNKILKITLKVLLATFIFVIGSYLFGIIKDVTVYRKELLRHSYGWVSPNCLILTIFPALTS